RAPTLDLANRDLIDSHLHHNRVAGALVSYQKDFVADNNYLAWNGHEADGGTGYGITAMAGSYNFGVTFTNNTTDHNYRKGLDVHDGNDILIENNTAIGDRLYGIAVYNRQFTMDNVKIINNTIKQDPDFRLETDDNPRLTYHGYSGIQVQTNAQFKELKSADAGHFEIRGNTIENLTLYKNSVQTYGIEFRNHEQKMHYTLDIAENKIIGESSKYMIAIINNTKNLVSGENGLGSGTINIIDNYGD
ncbi:MAG TPA: right-handed parallel beta-helix repeat-containing protein, partial [Neisseria sp.]|nr:right-handed parallel beta-helix repeat-containing protein [Neisseria sp.]